MMKRPIYINSKQSRNLKKQKIMKRILFLVAIVFTVNVAALRVDVSKRNEVANICRIYSTPVQEEPLELQNWMVNDDVWY